MVIILVQGDEGDEFYIIEEGSLVAIKDGQEVLKYGPGDYFGELALIKNIPRQASVLSKVCLILKKKFYKMVRRVVNW